MDTQLLDELLYEDESPTLDFKQEQYIFENGNAEQKGELLKDILAFANAWRRSDAFILIGTIEIKGGRSQVCGIEKHLDEASLQQFVNEKANRPIDFSYQALEYEGKQIGIIQIPLQERPFYLLKRYGKLENEKVYLRRGSSTAIAKPDEIAKMGMRHFGENNNPTLDINFANSETHTIIGKKIELTSKLLLIPSEHEIPTVGGGNSLAQLTTSWQTNTYYYKEFANYLFESGLLQEITFVLENTGEVLLKNPILKFSQPKAEKMVLKDIADYPDLPRYSGLPIPDIARSGFLNQEPTTTVYDRNNHWEVIATFGDIQPKAKGWSESFYIGVGQEFSFEPTISIFADNLPQPIDKTMEIFITSERIDVSVEEIMAKANEHIDK